MTRTIPSSAGGGEARGSALATGNSRGMSLRWATSKVAGVGAPATRSSTSSVAARSAACADFGMPSEMGRPAGCHVANGGMEGRPAGWPWVGPWPFFSCPRRALVGEAEREAPGEGAAHGLFGNSIGRSSHADTLTRRWIEPPQSRCNGTWMSTQSPPARGSSNVTGPAASALAPSSSAASGCPAPSSSAASGCPAPSSSAAGGCPSSGGASGGNVGEDNEAAPSAAATAAASGAPTRRRKARAAKAPHATIASRNVRAHAATRARGRRARTWYLPQTKRWEVRSQTRRAVHA